ncbi:gp010 [Erwinia phage vB_EamP-S6]|uniref:Gp010 n=1 Tax=Erwinia phage vB_EamP-S6 TaxID=1051675 RepID=G0YQA2_9CAUD|nr:gp010 [Erwinia phage vB_EamP-S6]AEJ81529.1 gp010 [Erwinia phage vB_EamP-S6]
MLRYEMPRLDLLGILDNLFIFREFIDGTPEGGTSLMYRMMEYHLDPELDQ